MGTPPENLGSTDGSLRPCENPRACVGSGQDNGPRAMQPIEFDDSPHAAMDRLKQIVAEESGATVVTASDRYLHAKFRSAVFRFVDDVEFLLDEANDCIHFRSSSRFAFWDFGVNRRRMQKIAAEFNAGT